MNNESKGLGNSYTAEYWEYDSRLGRRWNLDPKPNVENSEYAVFNNNPTLYIDTKGDTTAYYSNNQELLLKTYEKGTNRIMIVSDDKVEAIKEWGKKFQKAVTANKNNDQYQNAIVNSFKDLGVTYDLHNFESFFENYYKKGDIYSIGDGLLSTAYDIKLDGKSITRDQLLKHIKSLGVGPEYIASLIQKNGIVIVGNDIDTDGDLTAMSPRGRRSHIHNHPPITLDLTFRYKRNGESFYSSTYLPLINSGIDAVDQGQAHISGLRSVVIDGLKIYLYNGINEQTIRFNRKKRENEHR